ncbi:MAG: YbaB/EbfC family nucleoid-associated protein [Candidatus Puniceispirillum sp.]
MMRNMAGMMKKVQEMQGRLESLQDELAEMRFTAEVGGGAVRATVSGAGRLESLSIAPSAISGDDTDMLEDMICLATNNAHQQAAEAKAAKMKEITGGLPLPPGMSLPF